MAPRKSRNMRLERDHAHAPADPNGEEQDVTVATGGSNNEERSLGSESQADDESTLAEPGAKKTSSRVPKTEKEKAVTKEHNAAATEALLSDRFLWKDAKPEPFEQLRKHSKYKWERLENESHCKFVDRMHQNWNNLEQETRRELETRRGHPSRGSFDDEKEVRHVEFVWNGRHVRCETFLEVDLSDPKDVFKSSKILDNINKKMADYDIKKSEERLIRVKLLQQRLASRKTKTDTETKKGKTSKAWKELIVEAYDEVDSRNQDEWEDWVANGEKALQGDKVDGSPEDRDEYKKNHDTVTKNWKSWGSGGKEWTKDKKSINDRNLFASDPDNNILRRPCAKGHTDAIYMAFDRNSKLIVFLDPHGIPWSYDEEIHKRMKEDAHEFYSQVKQPSPTSNARHTSQREHLRNNPTLEPQWCGSDHYGHWHATQHDQDPMVETHDVNKLNATNRQLLLQFLRYTGGPRVLDFWFGVWEPDLRQRFRDIYAKSPEFARLPPVNADHPETYCLRVAVCNRPTDEHRDKSDIKGGLTGLVHLGDFTGAVMCMNQLGIALDGYGDGAVRLFRGTEMRHYISRWSGKWGKEKDHAESKASEAPKAARKSKNPDNDVDGKPDGGDAPAKPQRKKRNLSGDDDDDEGPSKKPGPKKSRKLSRDDDKNEGPSKDPAPKKSRKRSRDDDDDEGPSKEPAPKKTRTTLPVRKPRQTRTKK